MSLRALRNQRKGFIAKLEKLHEDVLKSTDVSSDAITTWETKLSSFELEIGKLNERIMLLIEDENEEEEESTFIADLCEKCAELCGTLKVLSCRVKMPAPVLVPVTVPSRDSLPVPTTTSIAAVSMPILLPDSTSVATVSERSLSTVRLPKLHLKSFSGREVDWQEFIDMYNISVHESNLPAVQKFIHLKSLLSNEAAQCIANIELSASNYTIAYDRLKTRYGNLERQRNRLVGSLINMPVMDPRDSKNSANYVDNLISTIRALEKLGVNQEQYGTIIQPVIESKLPVGWRLQWRREKETGDSSFGGLLSFLEREIRIRQTTELGSKETGRSDRSNGVPEKKSSGASWRAVPTASALPVSTSHRRVCVFCDGDHFARNCGKSMPVEERWRILRSSGACFKCGVRGHHKERCFYKGQCDTCNGEHLNILCRKVLAKEKSESESKLPVTVKRASASESAAKSASVSMCQSVSRLDAAICLRTCTVKINSLCDARVLCDTGCNRSFIKRDVVDRCGLKPSFRRAMTITSFGGKRSEEVFDVVRIKLHGVSTNAVVEVDAYVVDEPVGSLSCLPLVVAEKAMQCGFKPLADVPTDNKGLVDIILGEDLYDFVVVGPTKSVFDDVRATWTIFGWMLHGSVDVGGAESVVQFCVSEKSCNIDRFWDLEHLGISDFNKSDFETDAVLSSLTRDVEGRYSVGLPWRSDLRPGRNYEIALGRLKRLDRKLSSPEHVLYDNAIKSMVKEGYAEEAPVVESKTVCYLPHRPVFKEDSFTTKTRMVLDPSLAGRHEGLALNECLQQGPNFLPELFDILLRFRLGPYVVLGDFEKAFWQVRVHEADRDALRFLWKDKVYRMTCVPFGLVCSPSILQVVVRYHLQNSNLEPDFINLLLRSLYVDDLILSLFSETEAVNVWNEAVKVMASAKINLRKLRTNVSSLLQRCDDMEPVQKVVGIVYDFGRDVLLPAFSVSNIHIPEVLTKRKLASILAQVYDPLGLICPFISGVKVLLQDVWLKGLDWDEPLALDCFEGGPEALQNFKQAAATGKEVTVPRWVGVLNSSDAQLHIFCDSSRRLYAACAYLRVDSPRGICCSLIAAKSRLITPKLLEVKFGPKFELLACYLAVKLSKSILSAFAIVGSLSVFCWTDSLICLNWIRGNAYQHDIFVRNRLLFIKSSNFSWGYVPTDQNPADIPTRGTLPLGYLWWSGPSWLSQGESDWPSISLCSKGDASLLVADVSSVNKVGMAYENDVVNPKRVSRWRKLVRSLAWVAKIFNKSSSFKPGEVSVEEEAGAELMVLRQVQRCCFGKEINDLDLNGCVSDKSRLYSLLPILHADGFVRIGGRIENADVSFNEKHPIIVARCGAVDLLVQSLHEKLCHSGAATVLSELRRRGFWILQGRRAIRSILLACRRCHKFSAGSGCEHTPQLPKDRVTFNKPFHVIGVDLGGPLLLKGNSKVWFALFTCFTTRAVHLELVSGLSEEAFGRALMRFVARRGEPSIIWSDHGSNFVSLSKWAARVGLGVVWKFIVERGPWWGGVWEKLIGVVKIMLKKVLGKLVLSWEELETVLSKVESAVNKRPITYLYESSTNGIPIALCPEMFLLGANVGEVSESSTRFTDLLCAKFEWGSRMESLWRQEYLLGVLGESKRIWKNVRPIAKGEVVLVEEEFRKRQTWPLAVVEEVFTGIDGRARSAKVGVSSTNTDEAVSTRYGRKVDVRLKELTEVGSQHDLLSSFKNYGDDLMKLAKLTGLRQADLLDPRRKDDMAAARAILRKSSRMLLTTSKAYVNHPDVVSAKQNRDYVMQQVCEAVAKISDVAQASGLSKVHPFEEPGALAADLDELIRRTEQDASAFHGKSAQQDLQGLVHEILRGSADLADSSGTRSSSREQIFDECESVKLALESLVNEYIKHSKSTAHNVAVAKDGMSRAAKDLSKQLHRAVVDHVSDSFMETNIPLLLLCEAAQEGDEKEVEESAVVFNDHCNKLIEVAYIACSMSMSVDGNKMVKMAAGQLSSLCPQVINAARTLAARPKSKVARENVSVFRDTWLGQVRVLTEAVDDIIAVDDFLSASEAHILEDVNRCVEAMQRKDADALDRLAGTVRARVMRVDSVVTGEMGNYEPGPYTETVIRAVMVARNNIMPQFVEYVAMAILAYGRDPVGDIDENVFIDAARMVYEGIRDIRRAVMMKNPVEESDSEKEESSEDHETLLSKMADAQARQRERLAYEQLRAGGKVQFEVHSEAADDPGYGGGASIVVNGVEYCPKKRGYNIVVLDQIGTVVASRAFDTSDVASGEGRQMMEFLRSIPDDHVVLIAVQDTAGKSLEEVDTALQSVGAVEPVNPGYRCAWAFAGYKGAFENKNWVSQVSRPRYEGPVMISDMINTPAADMGKIQVEISSEGCEDRGYSRVSSIKVNGVERSPMGRGMNVVVLDSAGNYLLSKTFDTADPQHASSEGRRMAKFLDELPSERMVCVSSLESVGAGFDEVRASLLRLGAEDPVSPGQNGSYAFIGYTGPQKVAWLKQVACHRKGGPAKIAELIRTPASEGHAHADEGLAEYEPVPVEEYDFDADHRQSDHEEGHQSSVKRNARSIMRDLPADEKAKIAKLAEGLQMEKNRLVTEVSKWDDQGNDIIVLAKKMCMIMMDMSDFTRGSGPLKTTMDVIEAAERIARYGAQMNKLAGDIAEKCPVSHTRSDLLAYLQRIALYSHQLTITARVKADVQMISGEIIVSGVDAATSLIQAAKNLMNAVILTVKASYVASTKHRQSANPAVSWRMKAPAKKPLVKMEASRYRARNSIIADESPVAVLSDFE